MLPGIVWREVICMQLEFLNEKETDSARKIKYILAISLEAIYFQIKSSSCLPNQDFHSSTDGGSELDHSPQG